MPTTNYNFTTITGTDKINLVNAINTPLQEIDTALKNLSDKIDAIQPSKVYAKGTTYDELSTNGFLYDPESGE